MEEEVQERRKSKMPWRAIVGWASYFIGMFTIGIGTLTPLGQDIFSVIVGLFITSVGIVFIYKQIKFKDFSGKAKVVQLYRYLGGLLFVPGLIGVNMIGYNPKLMGVFFPMWIIGLLIVFSGTILNRYLIKRDSLSS